MTRLWNRLVTYGFYLLYNTLAFTYDAVSWGVSLGVWRSWQRAVLGFLPDGAVVLELAHGTGNLQMDLQRAGLQTVAIDLSAHMGRIAHKKLLHQRALSRLVRARAQALPFATTGFDAVVSTFPTRFILEAETLQEVYRVLRPQGVLVVVFNGELQRPRWIVAFIEWLYRITGQREGVDMLPFFTAQGFRAEYRTVQLENSKAHLLIATKTP